MPGTQPGQIPCPECAAPLALPIEDILRQRPITCSGCGLQLTANTENSQEGIDALKQWYAETAEARDSQQQSDNRDRLPSPKKGRRSAQ